jgi:hypothetical protein
VKGIDYVPLNYEHNSELQLSLKLARTHFGNTKCAQADHMMQLKKQDQTNKPLNLMLLSHD